MDEGKLWEDEDSDVVFGMQIVKRQGYGSNYLNQWSWITFVRTLWYDL